MSSRLHNAWVCQGSKTFSFGAARRIFSPMLAEEDACARCGRPTPTEDLRLWTKRERLREHSRRAAPVAPERAVVKVAASGAMVPNTAAQAASPPPPRAPAITYRWITVAHALCADCHAVVEADGSRFHDHDRRRAWVVVIAVVGLFALAWAGFAPFTHNWIAAFWQNGAGGR